MTLRRRLHRSLDQTEREMCSYLACKLSFRFANPAGLEARIRKGYACTRWRHAALPIRGESASISASCRQDLGFRRISPTISMVSKSSCYFLLDYELI